jgi:hypothetical protein
MNTVALQNVNLMIPEIDMEFFRQLVERMGWTLTSSFKPGIEQGLEDLKQGKVYRAKNAKDMLNQILG